MGKDTGYNQEFIKPPWDDINRKEFLAINALDEKKSESKRSSEARQHYDNMGNGNASASRAGPSGNGGKEGSGSQNIDAPPENSEDWLAMMFADRHCESLRYVAAWGKCI